MPTYENNVPLFIKKPHIKFYDEFR